MVNKKNNEKKPDTTGHEWDGIKEYDVPSPRWWLITWIACIIWAFGYWIFYPTWPTTSGNTKGSLNWTQNSELQDSQKEILARKNIYLQEFAKKSFTQIQKDPNLMEFALQGGRAAFKENCAACHGTGAAGGIGFPNLNDDDWIWGGKINDIYTTLLYGIRSGHGKARFNQMPSFGLDGILSKNEINDVVEHVLSLSKKSAGNKNGAKIFQANCIACHGSQGKGNQKLGAPNLTDKIWLYGDKKDDLFYTIYYARAGVMPYWQNRLDEQTIRQLALYVHSLGGGQ
jgi:cytochrome c oxidase cbb3-type subunit 3